MIPYPVRGYLFLGNKKCRIYAARGVSQTPIDNIKKEVFLNCKMVTDF